LVYTERDSHISIVSENTEGIFSLATVAARAEDDLSLRFSANSDHGPRDDSLHVICEIAVEDTQHIIDGNGVNHIDGFGQYGTPDVIHRPFTYGTTRTHLTLGMHFR
jgi:hypothetical protein